jgi:uncharacterized protein
MDQLISLLTHTTGIDAHIVQNILSLLDQGATIPFIARYRKEMTDGIHEEKLREFEQAYAYYKKLVERKSEVLRLVQERGRLDEALKQSIEAASTLTQLEDLYRPYKEKKSTRAGQALAKGLAPLADVLQNAMLTQEDFEEKARGYIQGDISSLEEAIQGAQDILAERLSDDSRERELLRNHARFQGIVEVKPGKNFNESGLYANYKEHREKVNSIPSHRYLAIMRGVREKELQVKIRLDLERPFENICRKKIPKQAKSSAQFLVAAYQDGLKRLLVPAIEREIHAELKQRSDIQAVTVFGKNLSQLLLTPPVSGYVLMGVDPAYRTGCKLAVIDDNGKFLDQAVIFPTPPQNAYQTAKRVVLELVEKYHIQVLAIGNGTASRETQEFFARLNKEENLQFKYTIVSEAGASVYSASQVAQQEYPDLDVTIRGAISIAQRLRDPMAELVKIDPQSLGIGQYQHDVDQKLLDQKLYETIEALVNRVGVEVNSASASLLSYVAGLGPKLAQNIVAERKENGIFCSKKDLKRVKGLGPKAFEQCAGFLRIRNGQNLLDNTGIHPESYPVASQLQQEYDPHDLGPEDLPKLADRLDVGLHTLEDIVFELKKPGFDPREDLPRIPFREDVTDINLLEEGSIVSGVVRSIVDFGAFVDIGLKNDGLIHISEMSEHRVRHPLEVLAVNQYLPAIRVVSRNVDKGQVSLSLKKMEVAS